MATQNDTTTTVDDAALDQIFKDVESIQDFLDHTKHATSRIPLQLIANAVRTARELVDHGDAEWLEPEDPEVRKAMACDELDEPKAGNRAGNPSGGSAYDDLTLMLSRVETLLYSIERAGEDGGNTVSLIDMAQEQLAAARRICSANSNRWHDTEAA